MRTSPQQSDAGGSSAGTFAAHHAHRIGERGGRRAVARPVDIVGPPRDLVRERVLAAAEHAADLRVVPVDRIDRREHVDEVFVHVALYVRRRFHDPRIERGRLGAGAAGFVRHHDERRTQPLLVGLVRHDGRHRNRRRRERREHAGLPAEVVHRPGRDPGRKAHDETSVAGLPVQRDQQRFVRPARARAAELGDLVPGIGPPPRAPRGESTGELRVVPPGQSCHTRRDATESRRCSPTRARSSPPTSRSATKSSRPTHASRRPIGRGRRRSARWRPPATVRCKSRSARASTRIATCSTRTRACRVGASNGPCAGAAA